MKLILASHGPFAKSILVSAEMIIGKIQNAVAFSLTKEMGPNDLEKLLVEEISKTPESENIVIGLDLLGGTPSNVATKLMLRYPNIDVLTGINLPMVIEFGNQQMLNKFDLSNLIKMGVDGITDVKEKLKANDDDDED